MDGVTDRSSWPGEAVMENSRLRNENRKLEQEKSDLIPCNGALQNVIASYKTRIPREERLQIDNDVVEAVNLKGTELQLRVGKLLDKIWTT